MKNNKSNRLFLQYKFFTWPLTLLYNIFKGIIMSFTFVSFGLAIVFFIFAVVATSKIHKLITKWIEEELIYEDNLRRRWVSNPNIDEHSLMLQRIDTFMSQKINNSINWQKEGF